MSALHVTDIPIHPRVNMLTVDVECWDQIICRKLTGELIAPSRSTLQRTRALLALLRERGVKATFFLVGTVAEAFPELVREIDGDGHEVAAHGYSHIPLTRMTQEDFRKEVRQVRDLLTDILGKPVIGFRAPEFSIVPETAWALDILRENGFRYDSSIFPRSGPRHAMSGFPPNVARIGSDGHSLLEVPASTVRVLGRSLPVAGGGYFRLMPYGLIRRAVRSVNRSARPFVLYCHPYEFGPDRLTCGCFPGPIGRFSAAGTEFRFNLFRRTVTPKLTRLLGEFPFSSVREVLGDALAR